MFGIPIPPQPLWPEGVAYGVAAGCLAVGALILLWGRFLGRAFLCVVGVGAGLLLAQPVARHLATNPMPIRIIGAAVIVLLVLGLARAIWAVLAAVLFGAAAESIVLVYCLGKAGGEFLPGFPAANPTLAAWTLAVGQFLLQALAALWNQHSALVLAAICPAVAMPLIVGALLPRMTRIFMTSLLGGAAVVFGCIVAISQLRPPLWEGIWALWYVPLAVAAAVIALGLAWQSRGEILAVKSAQEDETSQEAESESPSKTRKKR